MSLLEEADARGMAPIRGDTCVPVAVATLKVPETEIARADCIYVRGSARTLAEQPNRAKVFSIGIQYSLSTESQVQ